MDGVSIYTWVVIVVSFIGYSVTIYWAGRENGYRDGVADQRAKTAKMDQSRRRNGW